MYYVRAAREVAALTSLGIPLGEIRSLGVVPWDALVRAAEIMQIEQQRSAISAMAMGARGNPKGAFERLELQLISQTFGREMDPVAVAEIMAAGATGGTALALDSAGDHAAAGIAPAQADTDLSVLPPHIRRAHERAARATAEAAAAKKAAETKAVEDDLG